MELPPARLQGDDGAQRGLVPQDLPHYIHSHWLGLGEKSACTTTLFFLDNKPCTEDNVFPKSNFRNCVFKSVHSSLFLRLSRVKSRWQQHLLTHNIFQSRVPRSAGKYDPSSVYWVFCGSEAKADVVHPSEETPNIFAACISDLVLSVTTQSSWP